MKSSKYNSELSVPLEKDLTDISELLTTISLIFDTVTDNIIIHDKHGAPVYCNQAMLKTVKVDSQKTFFDNLNNNQFPDYNNKVCEVLKTKAPSTMLYDLGEANFSRYIYDLIYFFPIKNKANVLVAILAMGRDLDHSKHIQIEETEKQKHYLRSLLDSFPFAVWMKNDNGEFLTVNNQFCQDFGFKKPQEVLGKTDFDLFDLDMAQGFVDDDMKVMATREQKRLIEKIQCTNGSTYLGYTHKSPLKVDDQVVGTVGFTRDISEELRLQAQIAELENDYALLINNMPIAIMVYDLECRRVLVNDHYSKLVRCDGNEFLGKTPIELWSQHVVNLTSQDFESALRKVMQTGLPITMDIFFSRDDSSTSVHDERLVPRVNKNGEITGVIAIVQDITEIHESKLHNQYLAHHDALTGLANRSLFNIKLEETTIKAKERHTSFAIMILDLDGFKSINDSMGHAVGDLLLKEVANRLSSAGNASHFCTRLGGDEFAILHENITHKRFAESLAESILKEITNVYKIDNAEYFISASIGIALYPNDTENTDDLLKYADMAMYAAKDEGRHAYRFYDVNLSKRTERNFHVENSLRYAIEQKELYLLYQPIVEIASNRIVGVESLCRWQSKSLGTVPPDEFITAAEHTGLIIPLGKQILKEAFEAAYQINHGKVEIITFSVNLSARQLNESNIVTTILALLNGTNCNPKWIKFEITESVLLDESQQVLNSLNRFNQLGIKIALDDFGTGQSALSYLHKFPIQQIKIDGSFIHEIDRNEVNAKLVKAIIALGNSLDKELVAECIETQIQAEMLESFGCALAQGYFYSKPISLEELKKHLAKNSQ